MNAEQLIIHLGRMCDARPGCDKCPINDKLEACYACSPDAWVKSGIDVVDIVEKWATDHPVITNKDKFEEVFGVDFPELTQTWLNTEYKEPEKREAKDEENKD